MGSRPHYLASGKEPKSGDQIFYLSSPENLPRITTANAGVLKFGRYTHGTTTNGPKSRYTLPWMPDSYERTMLLLVKCKANADPSPSKYEENLRERYRDVGALCAGLLEWIYVTESMKYKLMDDIIKTMGGEVLLFNP